MSQKNSKDTHWHESKQTLKKKKRKLDDLDLERSDASDLDDDDDMQDINDELELNQGTKDEMFESDSENENDKISEANMSSFEKQQSKLQKTISELEKEAIAPKSWTLQGEVNSKARPVNSLLEEHIDVERVNKPVPVITEEATQSLEDIIKQRIADNAFDDVEKKLDAHSLLPSFDPNRHEDISDEKSKKSLAEVYEAEYQKQVGSSIAGTEKEITLNKSHAEIDALFKTLCTNLDALSNWHYVPKPAKPDLEIVPQSVPAIQMEEIIPVGVSDAMLLAPEETYEKERREIKGESELQAAEKKRIRAKVKKENRIRKKQIETAKKMIDKYGSSKGNIHSKQKALAGLLGNKNVTIISDSLSKKHDSKKSGKKPDPAARIVKKGESVAAAAAQQFNANSLKL